MADCEIVERTFFLIQELDSLVAHFDRLANYWCNLWLRLKLKFIFIRENLILIRVPCSSHCYET